LIPADRLCQEKGSGVDPVAYKLLLDIVTSGVSGQALCAIDSSIVNTQHDCLSSNRGHDLEMLATLMHLLASSWREQRVLERADQLYRRAYEILKGAGIEGANGPIRKTTVLQAWAVLKLERGESQQAKELAELQASVARAEFEADESHGAATRIVLYNALRFQAVIYDSLGLAAEAEAARQEVKKLPPVALKCTGDGCETITEPK
jgi:hypothetical protein